jgi:hypothetical protein
MQGHACVSKIQSFVNSVAHSAHGVGFMPIRPAQSVRGHDAVLARSAERGARSVERGAWSVEREA